MHIRTVLALAALVGAAPLTASAQGEDAPRWTIGAGLGGIGEVFLFPSSATAVFLGAVREAVPVATVFVERRLEERSWLVVGLAGNVRRESFDPPPPQAFTAITAITEFDDESGSLLLGLRRVVTRPGAIVDVSLLGSVEGGYGRFRSELLRVNFDGAVESNEIEDRGGFVSGSAGIVVERVLASSLALRISTPLVGVAWSRVERTEDDVTRKGSATEVLVGISPRIELRLAF